MIKRRYHLVFTILRPIFRLYLRLAYNYRPTPAPRLAAGQPALILANHNCNLDPFMISVSFRRPIFFVASDHLFRLGWISAVIRFLVAPIPIVKSQLDLRTIRTMIKVMQDGGAIGLFPEGNRSFNGRTGWFPASTGKLVRQLNCTLVLYRIDGGYLTTPRWAIRKRRGIMHGSVVRSIEPPELAAMTPEAINDIIRTTLTVDAYAGQKTGQPVRFRGRRLAEALERTLFVCPKCRGLDTLRSQDDRFACPCGLTVRLNDRGLFEPADDWSRGQRTAGTFIETVADWDSWQRQALVAMLDDPQALDWSGRKPIFTESAETLYSCERANRTTRLDHGRLSLFVDRLVFDGINGSRQFALADIARVIVHGPQVLQFATTEAAVFELKSQLRRSAYKYVLLFHLLEQKRQGKTPVFFGI